jgi:hypothetical protein
MHLNPTGRVSNINFDIWNKIVERVVSINIPWKIYQERQISCPLGVQIKGIAVSLTDLST